MPRYNSPGDYTTCATIITSKAHRRILVRLIKVQAVLDEVEYYSHHAHHSSSSERMV